MPSWRLWTVGVVTAGLAAGGGFALAPPAPSFEDGIVAVHTGDGSSLQALVQHGACEHGRRRIEVRESPAEVRLRVLGARPDDGGMDCPSIKIGERLTVRLSSPLGGRHVVDWSGRRQLPTFTP
jgi:hypothetical protein